MSILSRFRQGRIVATIPMDRLPVVSPVQAPNVHEPPYKDWTAFDGYDRLELYWDGGKDRLVFLQEFGGTNELDDEDVKKVMDMCMAYLRRRKA